TCALPISPDGLVDTCGMEIRRGRRPVDIGQGTADDGGAGVWREVFGVCAAAGLYRRSALQDVSEGDEVFVEAFVMHKEDVDLAWRLRSAGYRAGVDTSAIGYHARGVHRAADVHGRGAIALFKRMTGLVAQERAKRPSLRRRAWRNQVLLLMLNERPDDFVRSFGDLLAYQALQTGISFWLDPIGTIQSRVALVRDLRFAHAARRRRRARRGQPLRDWLP
ncbi:MAG: glycosyltransferase family 2 protein, partial [Candidatus Limnocylindrales bacterium]